MKKVLILVFFFLPACALKHQSLGEITHAPTLTESSFIAADGRDHALSVWAPESDVWAVVVALHGFNDYRKAFEKPGEYFASKGVLVMAYDQRGFGEDPEAGYWAKKEALKSDVLTVLSLAREKYPGVPVYLMGESMGGAVALYALAEQDVAADGLILVAPAVWGWRMINIVYRPALWLTTHLMPGKKFSGKNLKLEPSDNIDALIAMSEDPNIIKKTRIDAIYGLSRIARAGMKAAPEIRIPTYMIYGDKDDLVPYKMFKRLWNKLPANPKTFKIYEDGYHLLLRDCQGAAVWNDILMYLGRQVGRDVSLDNPEDLCQPSLSSE